MALTLDECEAMNAAAERNGVAAALRPHAQLRPADPQDARDRAQRRARAGCGMIHTWNYTDCMYRPRMPHELDTARGGGVVFIQGAAPGGHRAADRRRPGAQRARA